MAGLSGSQGRGRQLRCAWFGGVRESNGSFRESAGSGGGYASVGLGMEVAGSRGLI